MTFQEVIELMLPTLADGTSVGITGTYDEWRESTQRYHRAWDFNYRNDQNGRSPHNDLHPMIYSPISGTIGAINTSYNTVCIIDADGNRHEFLHMDSISHLIVTGQTIEAGQPIGTIGGKGPGGQNQYPIHVHYQLYNTQGQNLDASVWWENREINLGDNDGLIHPELIAGSVEGGSVNGTERDEHLQGKDEVDVLNGGGGKDRLSGGGGQDIYVIGQGLALIEDNDWCGLLSYNGTTLGAIRSIHGRENAYTDNNGLFYSLLPGDIETNRAGELHIFGADGILIAKIYGFNFESNNFGLQPDYRFPITPPDLPSNGMFYNTVDATQTPAGQQTMFSTGPCNDLVNCGKGNETVYLGVGDDYANGGLGNDIIYGGLDNDVIFGSSKTLTDETEAANDADILIGGQGRDLIYGGIGNDIIIAGERPFESGPTEGAGDWALGGTGNDLIYGSQNDDFLHGGAGQDYIHGGSGHDVILGDGNLIFGHKQKNHQGAPSNMYAWNNQRGWTVMTGLNFANYMDPISFIWGINVDTSQYGPTIENHGFTPDFLLKVELPYSGERVAEGGADDVIYGGDGNDWVAGQIGDDFIDGGSGNDIIYGEDVFYNDSVAHGKNFLIGGRGSDHIFGGDNDDILYADAFDEITGIHHADSEADYLFGGGGNDILFAGGGGDYLYGGVGEDKLHSGIGNTSLYGGADKDSYYFSQEVLDNASVDHIRDEDGDWILYLAGRKLRGGMFDRDNPNDERSWSMIEGDRTIQMMVVGNDLIIHNLHSNEPKKTIIIENGATHAAFRDLGLPTYYITPREVTGGNQAPVVLGVMEDQPLTGGVMMNFGLPAGLFRDPEGVPLTYHARLADDQELPGWLLFDSATGRFTATPPAELAGQSLVVKIWASDGQLDSQAVSFNLNVAAENQAPMVSGAMEDQVLVDGVKMSSGLPAALFMDPLTLSRIGYRDPESGKHFQSLTNKFRLAPKTIASKERWRIEIFFGEIKQNLRKKTFVGTSEKAVLIQIFVALTIYLLMAYMKHLASLGMSVQQRLQLVQLNLLGKYTLLVLFQH